MAPITASTTPTTTIAPGPSPDQSTFQAVVSLAMISPARMMATSPATIAEAFGPFGRADVMTLSLLGLSWIGSVSYTHLTLPTNREV